MSDNWSLKSIVRSFSVGENRVQNGNTSQDDDCLGFLSFEDDDNPVLVPNLVQSNSTASLDLEETQVSYLSAMSTPKDPNNTTCMPFTQTTEVLHAVQITQVQDQQTMQPTTDTVFSSNVLPQSSFFSNFIYPFSKPSHLFEQQSSSFSSFPTKSPSSSLYFSAQPSQNPQQLLHPSMSISTQPSQSLSPPINQSMFDFPQQPQNSQPLTYPDTSVPHQQPQISQPMRPQRMPIRRRCNMNITNQVIMDNVDYDDYWTWRKYGQKPIIGAPFPRSYYRCSSSKSCAARKHIERSPIDPMKYLITYIGEHNHPPPLRRSPMIGIPRTRYPINLGTSTSSTMEVAPTQMAKSSNSSSSSMPPSSLADAIVATMASPLIAGTEPLLKDEDILSDFAMNGIELSNNIGDGIDDNFFLENIDFIGTLVWPPSNGSTDADATSGGSC